MTAVVASTAFGPMLVPPYDEYLSQAMIRFGQYAPREFATWRPYLPAGGVVLDVGANIGAHTLPFATAVGAGGRVIAIEPQRALFYMLCGTIALGNLQYVITARHCAMGREPGTVNVPLLDYGTRNNFGGLELRGVDPTQVPCELVPCIPLDSIRLDRLDFLKIDVEGMELDVLHGGKETITRFRPVISVEADREKNVPAILASLRLNGYRAWWHRPPLGDLWPRVVSTNLLALPRDREDLPLPEGDVELAIE
jgi:FkbM family methyltransferase